MEKVVDLKEKYSAMIGDPFVVHDVITVNHKPHQFMIGTRHLVEASERHGGMLTEEVCRKIPCAHRGCHAAYDEHTSDRVVFLKLTRHATNAEVKAVLLAVTDACKADKIDGFAFIETPEQWRIE